MQDVPTVVPVLACPYCARGRGSLVIWNLPELPHIKFKFSIPTIPKFPSFHLPCIKILGLKVAGNCDPIIDINDDQSNDQSLTTVDSTTTGSSSSSECTATQTASDCSVTCNVFNKPGTRSAVCYATICFRTFTGCTASGSTATSIITSPCSLTYTPFSFGPVATAAVRRYKRVADKTEACAICPTTADVPTTTGPALDEDGCTRSYLCYYHIQESNRSDSTSTATLLKTFCMSSMQRNNRRKIIQDGIDKLLWIAKIMEVRAVDDKHVLARA